ncbi:MAG: 30S ribosomal protein S6 [Gemmatimonadetes bacterium]|jgi:small subunit ribosomal protein S6|nr:30S ribosomal protein S6 [Gemmatimonadota bacterium]
MKNYELVCILDPQVGEGQYEQAIEKYETYIKENGGEITQMDDWGLRRLAYTSASLKNRRQGYYVIFQFAVEQTMIDALEQTIKLDDGVLRYLLTGVDGDFIHVPQLVADNFLEEAFARPARGPRDRDRGGPRRDRDDRGDRGDRGSRDREERPSRAAAAPAAAPAPAPAPEPAKSEAAEAPAEAAVGESKDS